nr:hypothetical protein [Actinorhabdospora filicis]
MRDIQRAEHEPQPAASHHAEVVPVAHGLLRLQRAAGNAAVAALMGGGRRPRPVLAQRLVAQVGLDAAHDKIETLNVIGRPPKTHGDSMGDHTTANIAQVTALRKAVIGKTPAEARAAVLTLVAATEALPGHARAPQLPRAAAGAHPEHGDRFDAARARGAALAAELAGAAGGRLVTVLQSLITAFMDYRELVPLTTLNIGQISKAIAGKGKGEAAYHAMLSAPIATAPPAQLQEGVLGLWDVEGTALFATEADADVASWVAPGADLADRTSPIIAQHLASIETAYPGVIARAWGDVATATIALNAALAPIVAEKKAKNVAFYNGRIVALFAQVEQKQQTAGVETGRRREKLLKEIATINGDIVRLSGFVVANGGVAYVKGDPIPPQAPNPNPPKRKHDAIDREEIDRPGTAAALVLAADETVTEVLLEGRPPNHLPGTSMGAHSTAWIVHQDIVRAALLGKKVGEAVDELPAMGRRIDEMVTRLKVFKTVRDPDRPKLEPQMDTLVTAAKAAPATARPLYAQDGVTKALSHVNMTPGVAFEAGNTDYRNEATHRAVLRTHERVGGTDEADLRKSIMKLLDMNPVPGRAARLVLLDYHMKLIESAYPRGYADSKLGAKGWTPAGRLALWVKAAADDLARSGPVLRVFAGLRRADFAPSCTALPATYNTGTRPEDRLAMNTELQKCSRHRLAPTRPTGHTLEGLEQPARRDRPGRLGAQVPLLLRHLDQGLQQCHRQLGVDGAEVGEHQRLRLVPGRGLRVLTIDVVAELPVHQVGVLGAAGFDVLRVEVLVAQAEHVPRLVAEDVGAVGGVAVLLEQGRAARADVAAFGPGRIGIRPGGHDDRPQRADVRRGRRLAGAVGDDHLRLRQQSLPPVVVAVEHEGRLVPGVLDLVAERLPEHVLPGLGPAHLVPHGLRARDGARVLALGDRERQVGDLPAGPVEDGVLADAVPELEVHREQRGQRARGRRVVDVEAADAGGGLVVLLQQVPLCQEPLQLGAGGDEGGQVAVVGRGERRYRRRPEGRARRPARRDRPGYRRSGGCGRGGLVEGRSRVLPGDAVGFEPVRALERLHRLLGARPELPVGAHAQAPLELGDLRTA